MTEHEPKDPQNPATKPQGTLHDQEQTMEGEGQAATPGQAPIPSSIPDAAVPPRPAGAADDPGGSRRDAPVDLVGEDGSLQG